MADAISFDESFWIEEIDPADPESLSNVFVDYTPAFNLGECFKESFEVYLKYIALLDPLEADVLILYHYCDKKVKEIAKILRTTPVKVSGLVHQAEARLALLLHINILLSDNVIDELKTLIQPEQDLQIFLSFLREVSRRRTAHVMGLTFHQVSDSIKRSLATLNSSEISFELTELIKVITPCILPPRETRQLDPSERSLIVDVISCPQQRQATITIAAPSYNLGCFYGSNQDILQPFVEITGVAYFSVGQAILVQANEMLDLNMVSPPFIARLSTPTPPPAKPIAPVSEGPITFIKRRVPRTENGGVKVILKTPRVVETAVSV